MTLIPADEVTAGGPHLLAVQVGEVVAPDPDRQKVIDATLAQQGFAVLNHPNWQAHYDHFPQELMARLDGYAGIEIYNGVVERLEGARWRRIAGIACSRPGGASGGSPTTTSTGPRPRPRLDRRSRPAGAARRRSATRSATDTSTPRPA
jgi:hypothetical protein